MEETEQRSLFVCVCVCVWRLCATNAYAAGSCLMCEFPKKKNKNEEKQEIKSTDSWMFAREVSIPSTLDQYIYIYIYAHFAHNVRSIDFVHSLHRHTHERHTANTSIVHTASGKRESCGLFTHTHFVDKCFLSSTSFGFVVVCGWLPPPSTSSSLPPKIYRCNRSVNSNAKTRACVGYACCGSWCDTIRNGHPNTILNPNAVGGQFIIISFSIAFASPLRFR